MSDKTLSPWRYLPNFLSALRIALIPLIIYLSLKHQPVYALSVFIVGALTDLADGHLARRCGWHSHFGALLDPIADKLFVLCLIPLLWHYGAVGVVFTTLVCVRYLAQLSVFPVLIGWLKRPFKVAPKIAPKLATAVAFTVLGLGFVQQVAIDFLPDTSGAEIMLNKTLGAMTFAGCLLEIWVLGGFLPRYWQIAKGKHDTFE